MESGYEDEHRGQNTLMGVKYCDHVSKEVGERKKAPSSFDFVFFHLKTNPKSKKLEAKKI